MKIDVIAIQPWKPNGEEIPSDEVKMYDHWIAGHPGSSYYCEECMTNTATSTFNTFYLDMGDLIESVEGIESVTLTTNSAPEEVELPSVCPICGDGLQVQIERQYTEILEVGKLTQNQVNDAPIVMVHPSTLLGKFQTMIKTAWLYCAKDKQHLNVEWGDDDIIIFDIIEEDKSESDDFV